MRPRMPGRRQRSFYDQVRILAAAGNGGHGKVSFFRDRFGDVEAFHPQLWNSFYEGLGTDNAAAASGPKT